MELVDCINNRRSIRHFYDVDPPITTVLDLIESAKLAPSAKNRQPWLFKIVRGEQKDHIAKLMRERFTYPKNNFNSSVNETSIVIEEAPILILVCRKYSEDWNVSDLLSIGAAIEHILLTAENERLGSLWIRDTYIAERDIMEYIGHEDLQLVSSVVIGYPKESPFQRPRKNLKDIILDCDSLLEEFKPKL